MSGISDELMEQVGNEIDTLCNVRVVGRSVIGTLFKAARQKAEGSMTGTAAKLLKKNVGRGDVVIIATGFPIVTWLFDRELIVETDGPPGAAVLARGVDKGLDAIPLIVTSAALATPCKGACHGAGLIVTDIEKALKSKPLEHRASVTSVVDFTTDEQKAKKSAEELIDRLKPKALIAIEMPDRNEKGFYHYAAGRQLPSELVAKADVLFEVAKSRGITTIGIGDGGNEVGMGNIKDTVKKFIEFGSKCVCPCGGGIAASTEVDLLISSVISNWGAYGIAAAISVLMNKPEAFPSPHVVKGALEGSVNLGALDGPSGFAEAIEDGVSFEVSASFLTLMKSITDWAREPAGMAYIKLKPSDW